MKRVTGIGGIFFNAKDPVALRAWYKQHLGIDVQKWGGTAFTWTDASGQSDNGNDRVVESAPPMVSTSRLASRPSWSTTASKTWPL